MIYRPSNLAERISNRDESVDGMVRETFRLSVAAARVKAREILSEAPQRGQVTIVEKWRSLPDGQIELTMRRLRSAD